MTTEPYTYRTSPALLDEHAGVLIDSAGNVVAKTNGDPRSLATMLRLIARAIEEEDPR